MSNNDQTRAVGEILAGLLDEAARQFKPGTKFTLLARQPSHPDGSRDMLVSDDDVDAAARALALKVPGASEFRDEQVTARVGGF